MKVLSVIGVSNSGKTTTIEKIIHELKRRGYSVGSIKQINHESFHIDQGNVITRLKKAGASLITVRGSSETDIIYPFNLPIEKVLSFYPQDYVILEGVSDINTPMIIAARNTAEIDERLDYRTLAISGVIANELQTYKMLPVINSLTDIVKLVDLIEDRVQELLPGLDADFCNAFSFDCRDTFQKILYGELKHKNSRFKERLMKLTVNGQETCVTPTVKNIF